jgi:hypothetical protein
MGSTQSSGRQQSRPRSRPDCRNRGIGVADRRPGGRLLCRHCDRAVRSATRAKAIAGRPVVPMLKRRRCVCPVAGVRRRRARWLLRDGWGSLPRRLRRLATRPLRKRFLGRFGLLFPRPRLLCARQRQTARARRPRHRLLIRHAPANSSRPGGCRIPTAEQLRDDDNAPHVAVTSALDYARSLSSVNAVSTPRARS